MTDKQINTKGGTYVGKDVNTGKFVGRDENNTTNNVKNNTTTTTTHFSGNLIIAITAVLVVGVIGALALLRDKFSPAAAPANSAPTAITSAPATAAPVATATEPETTHSQPQVATAPSVEACQPDPSLQMLFHEQAGQVVIDAQHCVTRFSGMDTFAQYKWEKRRIDGSCSGFVLRSHPNNGGSTGLETIGPTALYKINFQTTGIYYVHVRGSAGESYNESDRAVNDSILVGLKPSNANGTPLLVTAEGSGLNGFTYKGFSWQMQHNGMNTMINITQPGEYTLFIWMREDGVMIDRIWLNTIRQTPEGCNQPESTYS